MTGSQELFDNSFLVNDMETMDGAMSPNGQMIYHGPEGAGRSSDHATFLPGRSTPPFSFGSARVGPLVPSSIGEVALNMPLAYSPPYYHGQPQPGSRGNGSQTSPARVSAGFPLGNRGRNPNIAPDGQAFLPQYSQQSSEVSPLFGDFLPPTTTIDLYGQPAFDPLTYATWEEDTGYEQAGAIPGTTMGGMISPVATSRLGSSYGDTNSLMSSPDGGEISGESEVNFNGTTGLANYDSVSTTPISPDNDAAKHQDKRMKKADSTSSATAVSAAAASAAAAPSSSAKRPTKRELRSASRTSKNSHKRVTETAEERKSRNSHNIVEKQYRNRLNAQFESLLHTLPDTVRRSRHEEGEGRAEAGEAGEKRVSKAEVLDMARRHINSLEEEKQTLRNERDGLRRSLEQLRASYGGGKIYADGGG